MVHSLVIRIESKNVVSFICGCSCRVHGNASWWLYLSYFNLLLLCQCLNLMSDLIWSCFHVCVNCPHIWTFVESDLMNRFFFFLSFVTDFFLPTYPEWKYFLYFSLICYLTLKFSFIRIFLKKYLPIYILIFDLIYVVLFVCLFVLFENCSLVC